MPPRQLFSVVSGGGRVMGGRGMVASRDIEKGTLILEESPLAVCNTRYGTLQWDQNWNNFYTDEAAGRSTRLQSAMTNLTHVDRTAFNRLYAPVVGTGDPVVDRFAFNAFEAPGANHQVWLFVYKKLCFINHSCVPNATMEILQNAIPGSFPRGAVRLVASQTIPSGSEILINYLAEETFMLQAARTQELQQEWNFTCNCPGCATPLEVAIDTFHRDAASTYHTNLPDPNGDMSPTEIRVHIRRLEMYIKLLDDLGVWNEKVSEACYILATLQFNQGPYGAARFAAIAGLRVEEHRFQSLISGRLNHIVGQCYVQDPRLREEYDQATLGPFPMY